MLSSSRLLSLLLLAVGSTAFAAEPASDRYGDPLPEGALTRLGSLRLRSEHPLFSAAFSPDGKTLMACDAQALSFWDLATGKATRRVTIKSLPQTRLRRFSGDGKTLILSGFDNVTRFIDPATGEERHTLNHAAQGYMQTLDVSRDGKMLAAVHRQSIVLWNAADGKLLHEFKGPQIVPISPNGLIALTADGKHLVLPHSDSSLHLVDTGSGKELRAFEMPPLRPGFHPSLRLQRLAVSPDGRYLAYVGSATPLTVCELATGKRLRELAPPQGIVSGLAFTPNGRFLAVDAYTGIRLYGVLSGKEVRKLPMPSGSNSLMVFSPDGHTLGWCRGSHTIHLWDVANDRPLLPIVGHEAAIHSMVFFPDGKRLASADYNRGLMVWDIATGRDLAQHQASSPIASLTVDEDGQTVQFAGFDVAVHRWDLATGREERRQALVGISTSQVALSPDGRSLVIMSFARGRQLQLFDLNNDRAAVLQSLPQQAWISHMVFAPDSRRLATTSSSGGVQLWDRDTARLLREFKAETPARPPTFLNFTSDGRSLVLFDGTVRLREIASGTDRLQIAQTGGMQTLACSPDLRFVACAQPNGKITIHGALTGKQLAQWDGQQGGIRALAFSRDGRLLASGGANGTILLWKLPPGEELPATLKADEATAFWQLLAAEEAARAHRAMAGLAAAPGQAVPLIKERFRATGKPPTAEEVARLIAELDDDSFKVRERATRQLIEAGPDAAVALRAALAADPSAEKKGRIEKVLTQLSKGGDPERLRCVRAIEVLERIGTPQARDVLRGLAEKDIGATLRDEIGATLRRMEQRR